jgi:branched-chain amino acid transport system substrate-binding protein
MALALLVAALLAAGCPKSFDPRARPTIPKGTSPAAKEQYGAAQARFERDEYAAAAVEFGEIAKRYPDDPIRPQAELMAGIAAFKDGKLGDAAARLEPLVQDEAASDDVRQRARFWLGLAWAGAGRFAAARPLLEPFDGKLDAGDDRTELDAALAAVYDGLGDGARALPHYDRFFDEARPAERAHIVVRIGIIVDGLAPAAVASAYDRAGRRGPSAALLGRRLALSLCAQGKTDDAQDVLEATRAAREAAGLGAQAGACGDADDGEPGLLGVVLPLSGKRRLVGEAMLRGVTMVVGAFGPAPGSGMAPGGGAAPVGRGERAAGGLSGAPASGLWAAIRDGGESPEQAARAVDELAKGRVVAVVGPADREAARAAAERAEAAGVPLLSLDVAEGAAAPASPHVFRVVVPVELRAQALARAAIAAGAKEFAILAPDMTYGTRAAKAFRDEVGRLGGTITADVSYAKDSTSFTDPVKKLAKVSFDALFVPDTAARLELIAPQLAVVDLVVKAPGAKKPRRGRGILLLATAEALSPAFLRGSGRYTVGALFAPGFYPDDTDARIGPFVLAYRAAYGADPTYLDAYGFDAALCVRTALVAGIRGRAAFTTWLGRATVQGVTGDVHFDQDRGRADPGRLYQVVSTGDAGPAIRVHAPPVSTR